MEPILFSNIHNVSLRLVKAKDIDKFLKQFPYEPLVYLVFDPDTDSLYGGKTYSEISRFIDHRKKGIIKDDDWIILGFLPSDTQLRIFNNLEYQLIKKARSLRSYSCKNKKTPSGKTIDKSFDSLPKELKIYISDIIREFYIILEIVRRTGLKTTRHLKITGTDSKILKINNDFFILSGSSLYPEQPSFKKHYPSLSKKRKEVYKEGKLINTQHFSSKSGALSFIKGSPRNGNRECD